jgi:hypothetical protein
MLRGVLLQGKWRRLTSAIFGECIEAFKLNFQIEDEL